MAEPKCANRTIIKSAATIIGLPWAPSSGNGWVASCVACGQVCMRQSWRETYDWADAHSGRGWAERRWIPHTMTAERVDGVLTDTTDWSAF